MEHSILDWSIRALLMVAGTGLVLGILRIRAASALHRAWTAAMVAMLLLPVWTRWGPSLTAPVLPDVRDQALVSFEALAPPEIPLNIGPPRAETSRAIVTQTGDFPAPEINWQQILLAVYLAGFAAMLVRLIAGTLRVRAMRRHSSRADAFASSPLCATPVTIGWLRPVLLLPDSWQTWPAAKLEAVLTHEREHIRRRDPLVQWLALFNRCLFWFHPLAWWLERKLAALAEEACDAAVLVRGHAPHDYARYLIEMARSVNETGARIRWAGAVAFGDGKLPRRIRRIMDTPPLVAVSRAKSIASVALCSLMLAAFLACGLGRTSDRAPGQPTMAQQDQRDRARLLDEQQQRQRQGENAALWNAVLNASPAGAIVLLEDVKASPANTDNLQRLVSYYQSKKDLKSLNALTLWFIGQHPEIRDNWSNRPVWDTVWDQEGYRPGRELWTAQLKHEWASPYVYMNAAEYLAGSDNEQAEQILQEGRRRFPPSGQYSGLHWEMLLSHLYAWALSGSEGPMTGMWRRVAWSEDSSPPPNQTPYAQKVRAMLLASNDVDLLDRTVERLQGDGPNLEYSRSLNARALSIHPDDREANNQRDDFQRVAIAARAQANPASLSDGERMVLLQSQLNPMRGGAATKDTGEKARELLALAAHNPKDPNYGTAIFLGNIALGEEAMSQGDKSKAARLLLAASDAPPTKFLRYMQIDMSLPRKLVDAGERETVAKFLDRCRKFDASNKRLGEWAAEIRAGINPDLRPNSDLFRKAG